MFITVGTWLGPYEILAPLGAGGKGEVYRAQDTLLDRKVALKVLPADFANDADRLKRFEQEARATSALSHPNILTIFDLAPMRVSSNGYPVTAAGERFLFVTAREAAASLQFTVVTNWRADAKK